MRYAQFGSISTGTLRTEDLLDAFASELDYQLKRQVRRYPRKAYRKLINEARAIDPESDDAAELVSELEDALQVFAPPYAYFGAHFGDGADFGYWLDEEFQRQIIECGGLQVNDTSEVPRNYSGEVLHVNDHGNCTLYSARRGKLTEIWGVV